MEYKIENSGQYEEELISLYQNKEQGCFILELLKLLKIKENYKEEYSKILLVNDQIVGHILSLSSIVLTQWGHYDPITVIVSLYIKEEYRREGLGRLLVEEILNFSRDNLSLKGVISMIAPEYYNRLGFSPAWEYGITSQLTSNDKPILIKELFPKALMNVGGMIYFTSEEERLIKELYQL